MTISIHDLRHRVRIQRSTLLKNDKGELERCWENMQEICANIQALSYHRRGTKEWYRFIEGDHHPAGTHYKVMLRYEPGLKSGMRLVGEDKIYYIHEAPTHDTYKRWTQVITLHVEQALEVRHA